MARLNQRSTRLPCGACLPPSSRLASHGITVSETNSDASTL
jgi:hypothetical protein